jgi:hypothetical protein
MTMRLAAIIMLLLAWALSAAAQPDRGQIWVQVYDDRDGDGALDPGEPPITRGAVLTLLDESGVIVATARLDDSAEAVRGRVGIADAAPGSYTLEVTLADAAFTTSNRFSPTIRAGEGASFAVGVRRLTADGRSSALPPERARRARIALAGAGAAVSAGAMFAVGWLVYAAALRPRVRAAAADRAARRASSRRTRPPTGNAPPAV